jgi:two-component system, NarL family, response regulator YdfI
VRSGGMIRVLIKASSSTVKAELDALIRSDPSMRVVADSIDKLGSGGRPTVDLEPDVILVELESLDDETAVEVLDGAAGPVPVILLVRSPAAEWSDAFRRGARAVLPSDVTATQIAAAIEAAVAGLCVLHPSELERLDLSPRVNESPEPFPEALTLREIEVLRLLADGLANKEIAARLSISEHTVKFHVASIMGKLGAGSRTEAATLGIRRGLVLI